MSSLRPRLGAGGALGYCLKPVEAVFTQSMPLPVVP